MNTIATEARSVVVERELPHPPGRVWRALTQPHLIEEWLMRNDFQPVVGHHFNLRMDPKSGWNAVLDCEVLAVEPDRLLSYTWNTTGDEPADGLRSVVTWTLTPSGSGTHLRMEQSGFRPDQPQNYHGARAGWPRFIDALEQVVGGLS